MTRDQVVAVRLTGEEFVVWSAAAERSAFGSVARWCREAVGDAVALYPEGTRAWVPLRVPPEVVERVQGACARLNHVAMRSHRLGVLAGEVREVLAELASVVGSLQAAEAQAGQTMVPRRVARKHLVSVRVSSNELEEWTRHARVDGFARVSSWVRAVTGSLVGLRVPPSAHTIPESVTVLRRQLAGAITNLTQLHTLAESSGDATTAGRVEKTHLLVQRSLSGLYEAR